MAPLRFAAALLLALVAGCATAPACASRPVLLLAHPPREGLGPQVAAVVEMPSTPHRVTSPHSAGSRRRLAQFFSQVRGNAWLCELGPPPAPSVCTAGASLPSLSRAQVGVPSQVGFPFFLDIVLNIFDGTGYAGARLSRCRAMLCAAVVRAAGSSSLSAHPRACPAGVVRPISTAVDRQQAQTQLCTTSATARANLATCNNVLGFNALATAGRRLMSRLLRRRRS